MANKEQFEYNRKSKKELKELCDFYAQLPNKPQYEKYKTLEILLKKSIKQI